VAGPSSDVTREPAAGMQLTQIITSQANRSRLTPSAKGEAIPVVHADGSLYVL
jgi:hypothetical protein